MTEPAHFDPYDPACPSRQLLDRIGDRWTVLVMGVLADGPARPRDIAARVGGITPKMLTQTLKTLERDGLVNRTAYAEVPPRVIYDLTPAGATLEPVARAIQSWVREHAASVVAARERYDHA